MEYYGNNDWRDYLALKHHGILGMKWGRRNGPPYPLGASDHSASEKKAGWQKSLSDGESASARKKARYVRKESKKIDKYYKKDIKRADKETARAEKKYNKAAEKGSSRAEKLAELYRDKAVDSEALKRVKEKELEKLRNMSLKDIQDEKQKTKEQGKFLKDRISDSDEFYQQTRKRRENQQELQKTKSENRVTKDERNQIKEEVRKRASKETDDGLRDKLRELDQKYYEAHRADNYKEREKYGDMISDLRDDYISKSKDKARAEKEFDRINDEVMSQRTEPQQKKKNKSGSDERSSSKEKVRKETPDKVPSNSVSKKDTPKKSPAAGVDEYLNSINNGKKIAKTVLADPSRKLTQQELWDLDDYVEQLLFTGTKGGPGEEWYSKKEEEEYYKLRKYVDKKLGY